MTSKVDLDKLHALRALHEAIREIEPHKQVNSLEGQTRLFNDVRLSECPKGERKARKQGQRFLFDEE